MHISIQCGSMNNKSNKIFAALYCSVQLQINHPGYDANKKRPPRNLRWRSLTKFWFILITPIVGLSLFIASTNRAKHPTPLPSKVKFEKHACAYDTLNQPPLTVRTRYQLHIDITEIFSVWIQKKIVHKMIFLVEDNIFPRAVWAARQDYSLFSIQFIFFYIFMTYSIQHVCEMCTIRTQYHLKAT